MRGVDGEGVSPARSKKGEGHVMTAAFKLGVENHVWMEECIDQTLTTLPPVISTASQLTCLLGLTPPPAHMLPRQEICDPTSVAYLTRSPFSAPLPHNMYTAETSYGLVNM